MGLRERGLDVTWPVLAVRDGSKALRRAVTEALRRGVDTKHVAIEVAGSHVHRDTWSVYGAMSMLG